MGTKLGASRFVPAALIVVTLVCCVSFIARGVGFLHAVPAVPAGHSAKSIDSRSRLSSPPPPDVRAILARNAFDYKTGPLWPPPPAPEDEEPEPAAPPPAPPEPGPCEPELRVSGAAYISPGRAVVMFSGPDVTMNGARSVGMQVAGKTVTAIYPNVVVLRDAAGAECWVKLRSDRPREDPKRDAAAPRKPAAPKKKR